MNLIRNLFNLLFSTHKLKINNSKIEVIVTLMFVFCYMLINLLIFQFVFNSVFTDLFNLPEISFNKVMEIWVLVFIVTGLSQGVIEGNINFYNMSGKGIGIFMIGFIAYVSIMSIAFQYSFNAVISFLFNIPKISFIQSLQLIILFLTMRNVLIRFLNF